MTRSLSLAYLTAAQLLPPDAISLAARLGYDSVGLRILPVAAGGRFAPLIGNRVLLRETQARIANTRVGVFDVEIVYLDADFRAENFQSFLEICGALGAKAVLVAGDDNEEPRLTASFAAFCDAAAPYDLTADLEFMPWTKVPDANTARRIVEAASQPNGRVLIDALHVARSGTTLEEVAALPRSLLGYAQICDAPGVYTRTTAALIHTAREERLSPGEGDIDLRGLFSALPPDLPVSVEVPNSAYVKAVGTEAWACKVLADTRRVLSNLDPWPATNSAGSATQ
jgi:sugar phosphate isomerase/epimerase